MVESSRKVFVHPEMALIQLCILSTIIANSLTQYVRDSNGKNKALSANQGQIPPCVTEPGQTFCEEVPNYPYELIWNALKKAPFDVSKLLVDETPDSPDLGPLTFKEISKLTQDNYSAKTQKHSTTSNHEELNLFDEIFFNQYLLDFDGVQHMKKHVLQHIPRAVPLKKSDDATRTGFGDIHNDVLTSISL